MFTCFWPTLNGLRFDILYILWIKPISRVLDPKFKIQTSKSYKCLVALWTITAIVIFEWDHVHIQQTHTCRPQSKWICLILFNSQINKALFFYKIHIKCAYNVCRSAFHTNRNTGTTNGTFNATQVNCKRWNLRVALLFVLFVWVCAWFDLWWITVIFKYP